MKSGQKRAPTNFKKKFYFNILMFFYWTRPNFYNGSILTQNVPKEYY